MDDAQQVAALTGISAEAKKLAPILRGMCEGGGPEEGTDIYADDYFAADGDDFVIRAAQLLERIAILQAAQPVQEGQHVWFLVDEDDNEVMFFTEKPNMDEYKDRYRLKEFVCYPAQPQGEQK